VRVLITKVTPWHPALVRLQWELEEVGESGDFTFEVERSGSPAGPWTTIVEDLVDTYTYDDTLNDAEAANTLSLIRDIYYRIRAIPPSGEPNAAYSPVMNLDGLTEHVMMPTEPGNPERPVPAATFEQPPLTNLYARPTSSEDTRRRLLKRALMRNMYLMLKRLNGVEFTLLKRRHFGTRCTVCYDTLTRTIMVSHCDTCYGTSWVGGYYTPIPIYARIVRGSNSNVQTGLTQHGKDDVDVVQIQTLDFPKIDEGDIMVAKYQNRRFLVKQRYNTSLKNIMVHQTLTASELSRVAPEYGIDAGL